MKIFNFADGHSLVSQYMMELRDERIQTDMMRFRRNIQRIGEIAAYEISRTLRYREVETRTCLGVAKCQELDEPMVLATILRAGLPLHEGLHAYFDHAENAFVSAYRKYVSKDDFRIHIEYIAAPRIEGKTLVLCDPMLATGSSMELAYEALLTKGMPSRVILVSVIASRQAVEYVGSRMPEGTTLWVGAIDDSINEHKYIVPGLGDAGDLAFGEKEG